MKHKHADILEAIANGETEFEAMHPKSGVWNPWKVEGILTALASPSGQQFHFRVRNNYTVLKWPELE